jgi:hypothetical protein
MRCALRVQERGSSRADDRYHLFRRDAGNMLGGHARRIGRRTRSFEMVEQIAARLKAEYDFEGCRPAINRTDPP